MNQSLVLISSVPRGSQEKGCSLLLTVLGLKEGVGLRVGAEIEERKSDISV